MSATDSVKAELEERFDGEFESGPEEKTNQIGNTSSFGPGCTP